MGGGNWIFSIKCAVFYIIFSIDSSDYSEDQYMRCSSLCLAQICSGYTQSEKSETNCNTTLAARASTIPREATNSFESSCQIFLSFLWGQENIGLAADALVSWSLWERCLAAVATFRPRVSWSLGESRGVLAITIGISPSSAQPPPAHHLQTASRLHLASQQLFQI